MWHDLWEYSKALGRQWLALMTGPVISLVLNALGILKVDVHPETAVFVCLIGIPLAGFFAWRADRRHEYDLGCDIEQVITGIVGGAVGATVVAGIRNMGAQTTLGDWSLEIVLPHRQVIRTKDQIMGWQQLTLGTPGNPQAQVFTRASDLMEQTIHTPIPAGGRVHGVAAFVVSGVDMALIVQRGTKVRLKYRDVREAEHSGEYLMTGRNMGPLAYFPGIGP